MTRIFRVQYSATQLTNGKNGFTYDDKENIVARDAIDAGLKLKTKVEKRKRQGYDDVSEKDELYTFTNFSPTSITLEAEA